MATPAPDGVAPEVSRLAAMTLVELRSYWAKRWGEVPRYRSQDQLCRAVCYRIQVEAFGGLSNKTKRELVELAGRFQEDRAFRPGPQLTLKPGSALIREWGGIRHEVAVEEEGFVYQGERFSSLSKLAQHITGSKWNGLVFFGLKPRKAKEAVR